MHDPELEQESTEDSSDGDLTQQQPLVTEPDKLADAQDVQHNCLLVTSKKLEWDH